MNRELMISLGFKSHIDLIDQGRCPFCKEVVEGFEDIQAYKEFRILGLCEKCQDTVFSKHSEMATC